MTPREPSRAGTWSDGGLVVKALAVAPVAVARVLTVAFVAAAVLAANVALPPVLPANAATSGGGLEVSRDGTSFATTLPGVFDRIALTVPGDSQSSEFWVRNTGPVPARLRLVIAAVAVSDAALAEALTVAAGTTAYPGTAASLASAQPCRVLSEGELLAPGGSVRVSATLSLGALDGLAGQGGTADFALRASLSDAALGSLPPTSCGASGTDLPAAGRDDAPLASTGSAPPTAPPVLAAVALAAGALLLVGAGRRRRASR
jgi:hypothetical protein